MAKLRTAETFKAAGRPAQVGSLGIPNWIVLVGLSWVFATMWLVHNIKGWGISFAVLAIVYLAIKIKLRRDYNALRRMRLGFWTKMLCRDAHIWNGVTVSSYPSKGPRGIPRRV